MEVIHIDAQTVEVTVPNPDYYLTNDLVKQKDLPLTKKVRLPAFETHPVTTMVHVIPMLGKLNKELMFYLLPMMLPQDYKDEWDPDPSCFISKNGKSKKKKLPHFTDCVGQIIAGGLEITGRGKYFRGLRCTNGCFKNSISMDIVTEVKNVNIKLSSEKIQMCGATSDDIVVEAVGYLIGHINTVCEFIEFMRQQPQKSLETIKALTEQTRGELILQNKPDPEVEQGLVLTKYQPILIPTGPWTYIDSKIYRYLSPLIQEAKFHDYDYSYLKEVFKLLTAVIENSELLVAEQPVEYTCIMKSMVNYNYNLKFHIFNYKLQQELSRLFLVCEFYESCNSSYQNLRGRRVKITVPFTIPEDYKNKIKRNPGNPMDHTFTVTKKGPVTQSGPHEDLMPEVYYKVMGAIVSIKDRVEDLISEDVKRFKILELISAPNSEFADLLAFKKSHPRDFSGWLRNRCRNRSIDYSDVRASLKAWLEDNRKAALVKELDPGIDAVIGVLMADQVIEKPL